MAIFGEAEPPVYQPASGAAAFQITGVFDRAYREITLLDDNAAASTVTPVLGVRLADFPAPPVPNDRVTIASVGLTYVVRNVQPDGHGWAKLMLNVAAVQP
jgi:hypothetical protein